VVGSLRKTGTGPRTIEPDLRLIIVEFAQFYADFLR
jgi:hypothetical protein